MSMFPHTVTMFNVSTAANPATYEDETTVYVTVLRGVLLTASKAANVNKSGLTGADAVELYIPFDVEAADGYTGEAKTYLGPREFWRTEDKSRAWTMYIEGEGDGKSPTHEVTFFVKGEAVPPPKIRPENVTEYVNLMYEDAYNVTKIDRMDYGGLRHFEVGGN